MFDINGWELVLLLVLAVFVLGPERLPEYAAKLRGWIRQGRAMAEAARGQLREQMGPEFDDIDWQQFDPRQYDPRRIVREALLEDDKDDSDDGAPFDGDQTEPAKPQTRAMTRDPSLPTPYDSDAT